MPSVVRLATELAPRGLDAVLVSYREDAGHVRRVARERGYTARVLVDATGDTTGRMYGVFGTPTVYVIDREGRLVARGVGPRDWESPAARRLLEGLVGAPGGR